MLEQEIYLIKEVQAQLQHRQHCQISQWEQVELIETRDLEENEVLVLEDSVTVILYSGKPEGTTHCYY